MDLIFPKLKKITLNVKTLEFVNRVGKWPKVNFIILRILLGTFENSVNFLLFRNCALF